MLLSLVVEAVKQAWWRAGEVNVLGARAGGGGVKQRGGALQKPKKSMKSVLYYAEMGTTRMLGSGALWDDWPRAFHRTSSSEDDSVEGSLRLCSLSASS